MLAPDKAERGCLKGVSNVIGVAVLLCVILSIIGALTGDDNDSSSFNSSTNRTTTAPSTSNSSRRTPAPTKAPVAKSLEILDISIKDAGIGDGSRYVYVDIVNHSDKLFSYVGVDATCRNASGTVVATGLGNTMNVAPGERTTITAIVLAAQGCERVYVEFDDLTGLFD